MSFSYYQTASNPSSVEQGTTDLHHHVPADVEDEGYFATNTTNDNHPSQQPPPPPPFAFAPLSLAGLLQDVALPISVPLLLHDANPSRLPHQSSPTTGLDFLHATAPSLHAMSHRWIRDATIEEFTGATNGDHSRYHQPSATTTTKEPSKKPCTLKAPFNIGDLPLADAADLVYVLSHDERSAYCCSTDVNRRAAHDEALAAKALKLLVSRRETLTGRAATRSKDDGNSDDPTTVAGDNTGQASAAQLPLATAMSMHLPSLLSPPGDRSDQPMHTTTTTPASKTLATELISRSHANTHRSLQALCAEPAFGPHGRPSFQIASSKEHTNANTDGPNNANSVPAPTQLLLRQGTNLSPVDLDALRSVDGYCSALANAVATKLAALQLAKRCLQEEQQQQH